MSRIAIIPARGGSKRIPRKNIKNFLGRPIISYSIQTALDSKLFDEVMVSTDDEEIAAISKSLGASVPFLRSSASSGDFATTVDVLAEVLAKYETLNRQFKFGCCIYPTAPLLRCEKLIQAIELLESKQFDSVFPVTKFSYPIWRSLKFESGKIKSNWPQYLNTRSQDMPSSYHDAGQFYWFRIESFLKTHQVFSDNAGAIELEELEVQDIDNLTDWNLAELKFKVLNQKLDEED